jgi:hypothetical protein
MQCAGKTQSKNLLKFVLHATGGGANIYTSEDVNEKRGILRNQKTHELYEPHNIIKVAKYAKRLCFNFIYYVERKTQ